MDAAFAGVRAAAAEAAAAQKAIPQIPAAPAIAGTGTPDVGAYAVRGIDVSHFNGTVDWGTVAKDGLSFVYIKATEGRTVGDDQFAANWKGATSAGLRKGAYHFYDFCDDGASQAANFIKTVPVEDGALPPTIDLEKSADCGKMPGKKAFRKQLAAFTAKISAAYGQAPVLYMNDQVYTLYFQGESASYKLWIADPDHAAPQIPGAPAWAMWQYGWHGAVAGIPKEVDLDVFNGTPQMLASLGGAGAGDGEVLVAALLPR